MHFKILGPLELCDDDGHPVAVTRRLHRLTLALLLLNAGQPCSSGDLVDALWGDERPLSPDVSLRTCVYGIRKILPDAGRLRTHPSGYLIRAQPGELDLAGFRDLADRGRDATDNGDPRAAAELLASALELWREPPLADLPAVPGRDRLLGQRKDAQDALMDARLALGQHRQALPELRSIVAADPLREHAWAQLMIALYRCGARAEALDAFSRLRITLVSAYGIEPGPELQDLHRRVLTDEAALMIRAQVAIAQPADGQDRRQSPCQLPASVADFTGRATELRDLLERLPGAGMAVTVVTGMPGIGKTALAVQAAHIARPGFPDGQLYACLDNDGRPRDPQVVLGALLRGLGIAPDEIPAPGFEREALYRSALAGRRVLVLADGASSADQVRPLLPGTPGSAVVVTSRARLADLEAAKLIELGGLLPADSVSLIARISGREPAAAHAQALVAIAAACGHLPLALRIAGARLSADPGLEVTGLAELLADESRRLDELVVGEASVRERLAAAARAAGGPAQRAFALLAATGPRDTPGALIASLLEDPGSRKVAPALADAGLLQRVAGDGPARGVSYRMHPLVRAYAGELLAQADPGLVGSATGRLLASGWLELATGGQPDRAAASGAVPQGVLSVP